MSAASETEAWLLEDFAKIESGIAEYEKKAGVKPGLVIIRAKTAQILFAGKEIFESVPRDLLTHPAVAEVIERHKAGTYNDSSGTGFDVPIICDASTVYRTSVENFKMNLEVQALGVVFGMGSVASSKGLGGSLPKNRFKKRKTHR